MSDNMTARMKFFVVFAVITGTRKELVKRYLEASQHAMDHWRMTGDTSLLNRLYWTLEAAEAGAFVKWVIRWSGTKATGKMLKRGKANEHTQPEGMVYGKDDAPEGKTKFIANKAAIDVSHKRVDAYNDEKYGDLSEVTKNRREFLPAIVTDRKVHTPDARLALPPNELWYHPDATGPMKGPLEYLDEAERQAYVIRREAARVKRAETARQRFNKAVSGAIRDKDDAEVRAIHTRNMLVSFAELLGMETDADKAFKAANGLMGIMNEPEKEPETEVKADTSMREVAVDPDTGDDIDPDDEAAQLKQMEADEAAQSAS